MKAPAGIQTTMDAPSVQKDLTAKAGQVLDVPAALLVPQIFNFFWIWYSIRILAEVK